jgi:hypothetical protein
MVFAAATCAAFEIVMGKPRSYASTSFGERWFCGDCGTQLAMRVAHEPDTIDVSVASLDDPHAVPPGFHIWISSRIRWFETKDDLRRYDGDRPSFS